MLSLHPFPWHSFFATYPLFSFAFPFSSIPRLHLSLLLSHGALSHPLIFLLSSGNPSPPSLYPPLSLCVSPCSIALYDLWSMLIKQGACAIKSGKWALMATPLAVPAASMPFRTYGQRYISTLIRVALHRCLWKYFHNFPLSPPTRHCLQIGGDGWAGLSEACGLSRKENS